MPQNMSNPTMLSLLDDFHYLSILHFCQLSSSEIFIHSAFFHSMPYPHFKTFKRRTSAFISVYVSAAYSANLHTKHFIILSFTFKLILPVNNLLLSIKAYHVISILLRMSFLQYPSSDIKLPRYLNCSTSLSIQIFTFVFLPLVN